MSDSTVDRKKALNLAIDIFGVEVHDYLESKMGLECYTNGNNPNPAGGGAARQWTPQEIAAVIQMKINMMDCNHENFTFNCGELSAQGKRKRNDYNFGNGNKRRGQNNQGGSSGRYSNQSGNYRGSRSGNNDLNRDCSAQTHSATAMGKDRTIPMQIAGYNRPDVKAPGATTITKVVVIKTIAGIITGTIVGTLTGTTVNITVGAATIVSGATETTMATDTIIRVNGEVAITTTTIAAMITL